MLDFDQEVCGLTEAQYLGFHLGGVQAHSQMVLQEPTHPGRLQRPK